MIESNNKGLETALMKLMYHDPLYWKALGEFIEMFANTELALYALLRFFTGLTFTTSNAIFHGLRAKLMTEHMSRLLEANNHPKELAEELRDVFCQMSDINDARNGMIHYASIMESSSERIVTDRARRVSGEKRFHVSPEIISLMISDLRRVSLHCVSIVNMPNASLDERAIFFPALKTAWQYRHETNHPKKGQKKNPRGSKHPDRQ